MLHSSQNNSNKMGSRNKQYQCSLCDKSFSTQHVVSEHEATHDRGMFSCYHCGEVTRTLTKMVIHKRIHRTEDDQILYLGETDRVKDWSSIILPLGRWNLLIRSH